MPNIVICVRTPGKTEIEDSMSFSVPEVPKVGDYISVTRLDIREPLSEDYIVRQVWWRLHHPGGTEAVGDLTEIMVECDIACGPYSTLEWQERVKFERDRGSKVESFDVARITVGLGNYRPDGDQ